MQELHFVLFRAFCIALGVSLGGSLLAGFASLLFPGRWVIQDMLAQADTLKLWALVTALGGTFEPIKNIELGIFDGEVHLLAKQVLAIGAAFTGAHLGYLLIRALASPGPPDLP